MRPTKIIISSLLVLFALQGVAQISAPKFSNEFLAIGVGARAFGMGNAQVASVSDVTSGYWNPAGLLGLEHDMQFSAMHSEYFAGIAKYDYAAVAKRIDSTQVFGISAIRFGVDDIPNTTELIDSEGNIDYDRIKSFNVADYGFIFSYARKMKIPNLSLGANAKVIYRNIGDFASSWGFGIDVGLQYTKDKWLFGLNARDITTTFNAWNITLDEATKETFQLTDNDIPQNSVELTLPKIIFGAGRLFTFKKDLSLLAELDIDMSTDGKRNVLVKTNLISIDPKLGLEFGYKRKLFVRAGIGNFQEVTQNALGAKKWTFQPNMGVGINFKAFELSYALTDLGDSSTALYSNVFSLNFNINRK